MSILTNNADYYKKKLEEVNQPILREYRDNLITYARLKYPNITEERLSEFITKMIKERYTPLEIKTIQQEVKGNLTSVTTDKDGIDYLRYVESQKNNIRVPYGASYCSADEETSMFSDLITTRQGARKSVKNEMILAEARGDDQEALLLFFRQLFIKVSINIFSGVMKSNTNFKSVVNYNAITSVSRFGIMTGYAYAERLLEANYYFISYDDVVNWCINVLREIKEPSKLRFLLKTFELPCPSAEEVTTFYKSQILKYVPDYDSDELDRFFGNMSDLELATVYYVSNLKNTFFSSPKLKEISDELTEVKNIPAYDGEVGSIHALPDEEIFIYSLVLLSDELIDAKGKNITQDRIDEEFPEIARRIYACYYYIESKLKMLEPLFNLVVMTDSMPHDVMAHREMKREAVVLSDTDSILFTTVGWVEWMCGKPEVSTKAANISAFTILLMCKALIHVFRTIDSRMGMAPEHIDTLSMKNEFMYDVFIRVVHAKTYAGYNSYKEGAKLPKRKIDMKGKSFKGSDLCTETTTDIKSFFQELFDIVGNNEQLTSDWLLRRVIGFEQRIVKSVTRGDTTFFKATPIKNKSNYKKPESSSFFYAMLWDAIFKEKYGEMSIPGKTKVINIHPIKSKSLRLNEDLTEDFRNKLADYMDKYGRKELINIYIPIDNAIPTELAPLVDMNKCVTANCFSYYLLLQSFEIGTLNAGKNTRMLSEMYVSIAEELSTTNT